MCSSKVDSFKPSGEMKSYPLFEVDFMSFYAQNERKLSEFNLSEMARGIILKLKSDFVSLMHDKQVY
jgi:hypothetical protein